MNFTHSTDRGILCIKFDGIPSDEGSKPKPKKGKSTMSTIQEKLAAFAALVEQQQRARYRDEYPASPQDLEDRACSVRVTMRKKYACVDVGSSGKYMVDLATEIIHGIRGYGQVHPSHAYGTLDTTAQWNWGGYVAGKIS